MVKTTIKEVQVLTTIQDSFGFSLVARDENDNLILRKKHEDEAYFIEINIKRNTAGLFQIRKELGMTYGKLILDTYEVRDYMELPTFYKYAMEEVMPEVTWLGMNIN